MKKLITFSILGAIAYFLFPKAKNLVAAYQDIKIKIIGIKNIKVSLDQFTFNLTIQLYNPTTTPINAETSGIINLKKVLVYTNSGLFVGTATPQATNIDIPANGIQVIQDIPAVMSTSDLAKVLAALKNITSLKPKLEVEILGQLITI